MKRFVISTRFTVLSLVLLLAGCAGWQKSPPPEEKTAPVLTHWEMEGKLGIRTPEESGSTVIYWNQLGDTYDITLTLPFGRTLARVEGEPDKVKLLVPGQPERMADSAELLLWYQLGWRIPVSQLFYWVQGVPAPDLPLVRLEKEDNRITEIEQGGWVISYDRFENHGGLLRPARIKATYTDLKLTLVIKQWLVVDPVSSEVIQE